MCSKWLFWQAIYALGILAGLSNAHTLLAQISIDGQEQALNKCIRPYWKSPNFPVQDVTSEDLQCRTSSMSWSSTDTCSLAAGSKMTLRWNRNKNGNQDVISASHVGPCLVYMAPQVSNEKDYSWFKIYEDGYDSSAQKWCTEKLIANGGTVDVTIPADIKPGNYLVRSELIALHGARREGGCQFFPNCVQVQVTGGGSAVPEGVPLPGYYKKDDPGILYARKDDNSGYIIPGPPVYKAGSGSESVNAPVSNSTTTNSNTIPPSTAKSCVKKRSTRSTRKRRYRK